MVNMALFHSEQKPSFDGPFILQTGKWVLWQSTGCVAQWITCLTADTCLTEDPGVASLISAWSHTFAEIDHEMISTAILLPSSDSRRVVVNYKQKYDHKVLVKCLVKLAKEKSVVS